MRSSIFLIYFLFFARPNLLESSQPISSALKLKSEGHPQHLADRAETGFSLCDSFFLSFFAFSPLLVSSSRAALLICLSGFVRGLSVAEISGRRSLLGGVSGSPVSLHNDCWSQCFPASSSLFVLLFKEIRILFMFERHGNA